jgi:triphosphoribosyl-dephospho-CoA synthase
MQRPGSQSSSKSRPPMLADGRRRGIDEQHARLDALLAIMAGLDDTCVLYRGGIAGLDIVQNDAAAGLAAGGSSTPRGHARLVELDRSCRQRRLSPGGAGDMLAAALFLDLLNCCDQRRLCRP